MKLPFTTKAGLLTALFHWALCGLAIWQRGSLHPIHLSHEPILLQILILLDSIWLVLAELFGLLAQGFLKAPSILLFIGFFAAGLQWFLIGRFIGKIFEKK